MSNSQQISAEHIRIESARSFDEVRAALEAAVPRLNTEAMASLKSGDIERARQELERGPELSIFLSRDHGSLLEIAGQKRKALQYDIGNPLTASKMTRYELAAALYAPVRVLLYENAAGHGIFEYDSPATTFGQFGDERVAEVARELDAALRRVLQQAAV